jgi:hypothetical protein
MIFFKPVPQRRWINNEADAYPIRSAASGQRLSAVSAGLQRFLPKNMTW